MEFRSLGSLKVSLVGLGCNNFGMRCDEKQSAAVVNAALDAGINLLDTADVYGATKSEQFLGRALGSRRDEAIIATKFAAPVDDDPAHRGASARWISQAVEDSLRRLGTDHIDLYQQHVPDPTVPIEETHDALDRLVRDGKVREIGHSNFDADQTRQAAALGGAPFVSAQIHLNLLTRGALKEVVPTCNELGLAVLPYFPLASGMLTGKYTRGEAAPEGTRLAAWPEERTSALMTDRNFDKVEALSGFAADHGRSLVELAFAWLAATTPVASVIAGATRPEQVALNAAAADWSLTADDMAAIDGLLRR